MEPLVRVRPPALAPTHRPRRLRANEGLRRLVRETTLEPRHLIQPLFIREDPRTPAAIASMPGVQRLTIAQAVDAARDVHAAGIGAVMLFGIPASKDATARGAYAADGIVQRATRSLRQAVPDLTIIADTCLCEYTDHGHCGPWTGRDVDNDEALALLAKTAVSQCEAGADIVAPSAMMDGQVAAIRDALDRAGHADAAILSYAAKYASAYYGPFREAAGSTPRTGDRRTYQLDPANGREALREIAQDVQEGADMVLVKPGLPCLDIVRRARDRFDVPVGAYQVSGEYAMIKAAAAQGWIDEDRTVLETLVHFRRAGADFVITYYAQHAARLLAARENL